MDSLNTNEPDRKKLMLLDRAPGLGNRMVSMLADYEQSLSNLWPVSVLINRPSANWPEEF